MGQLHVDLPQPLLQLRDWNHGCSHCSALHLVSGALRTGTIESIQTWVSCPSPNLPLCRPSTSAYNELGQRDFFSVRKVCNENPIRPIDHWHSLSSTWSCLTHNRPFQCKPLAGRERQGAKSTVRIIQCHFNRAVVLWCLFFPLSLSFSVFWQASVLMPSGDTEFFPSFPSKNSTSVNYCSRRISCLKDVSLLWSHLSGFSSPGTERAVSNSVFPKGNLQQV